MEAIVFAFFSFYRRKLNAAKTSGVPLSVLNCSLAVTATPKGILASRTCTIIAPI